MIREEGKPMLRFATMMLALGLLLVSGCAAQAQRSAQQQSCNNGDQNACQQIAQDSEPATYPGGPNVRAFPSGQPALGMNFGSMGGLGSIGGMR